LVQILSGSGSALDPYLDPDLDPDPHVTNADLKHWLALLGFTTPLLKLLKINMKTIKVKKKGSDPGLH
jgi:hypothetical protein